MEERKETLKQLQEELEKLKPKVNTERKREYARERFCKDPAYREKMKRVEQLRRQYQEDEVYREKKKALMREAYRRKKDVSASW